MSRLKDKYALITGGTSGIGLAQSSVYAASKAGLLSLAHSVR